MGVPGALSNQPPGAGSAPEVVAKAADTAGGDARKTEKKDPTATAAAEPMNTSRRATRNYELDRTISHTRAAPGRIRRVTAAVVVDNKQVLNEDDEIERKPLSEAELARLTALVKEAVGFNAERSDSVQITNIAFTAQPEPEPPPEPSWFEQASLWSLGKQALGWLAVLALVFGVLRPMLQALTARAQEAPAAALPPADASGAPALTARAGYEQQIATAKQLAAQDPKRVARLVKNWVANDA
jgi:flagellar M-ring protein FliF